MLGPLIGYADLIKGEMKKTDPLYAMVEEIMTSGQRAATVVQDLLTMARRGVVLKELANLNKIVADQLKSSEIRNMLDSNPYATIKTKYDRDLLDINASSIHIERTLTNLISNSLRAMKGDGTITVTTENRYLENPLSGYEVVPKGEYAVLSVSDTGMGIFPEYTKNLFEPFYMRKVLKKGGSGLGLSVIWGAVKDHGGYIDVTSVLGQGTTFSLYFPVTRDDTVRLVEHSIGEYMGHGEIILVVDDEESQCRLADMMLTRLNYVVKTVESGEEALEYLGNHD
ncbi:MAG: ATP-binding protein, partial [Syntrophales bacterium LBB04]|nr:ATP-binding protein [Syntrophales bacterium LBB04]